MAVMAMNGTQSNISSSSVGSRTNSPKQTEIDRQKEEIDNLKSAPVNQGSFKALFEFLFECRVPKSHHHLNFIELNKDPAIKKTLCTIWNECKEYVASANPPSTVSFDP